MGRTSSTTHRRHFCRALYLQPSIEKFVVIVALLRRFSQKPEWEIHSVCPIRAFSYQRHISTTLTTNPLLLICVVIGQTSTAANKKCRQWDVRQVLPIDGIFAERCICSPLLRNLS